MKVIAFYLPQYYSFPENDKWWGKGFTEWTNVKKSYPLYEGHYQPTVPLNSNYYSLEDIETMQWQAAIAKKYNVYGFCFYHYWFGENRQLMEKPVKNWLKHKEIDFPFCLCWANHNWSRTWVGGDKDVLMDMRYGNVEEWEKHFVYLLEYFKDKRYIKVNNKPVLLIYLPQDIDCLKEMITYFKKRAIEEGLNGITFIAQSLFTDDFNKYKEYIDYRVQYEPNYSRFKQFSNILKVSSVFAYDRIKYKFKAKIKNMSRGFIFKCNTYDYDAVWDFILKKPVDDPTWIAGAFVNCDVTPRRQDRAVIYRGFSPSKFEKYFRLLSNKVKNEYSTDFVFISAWNEWGEGMYLEPDEKYGYSCLEAVKKVVSDTI